jgi:rubredoxin
MSPETLDDLINALFTHAPLTTSRVRQFAKHLLAEESQYKGSTVRIYAQVRDFRVACPKCGEVYQPEYDTKVRSVPEHFARLSGRWDCPHCKAAFLVGLILWPVRHPLKPHSRPADTVPSWQEAAALADLARGMATSRARGFNERVNVLEEPIEAETEEGSDGQEDT